MNRTACAFINAQSKKRMISSRTPEGSSNHCAVCGHDVRIEPSLLSGDAPCPNCGHLLWFEADTEMAVSPSLAPRFAVHDSLVEALAAQLDVPVEDIKNNPNLLAKLDLDSLDTVELVMKLEEERT